MSEQQKQLAEETDSYSVMLVDDHPLLRKGLRQLLAFEDSLQVVAEASSGAEAITLANELDPDLIILDLGLPDEDGQVVLKRLREWYKNPILILTVKNTEDEIVKALDN